MDSDSSEQEDNGNQPDAVASTQEESNKPVATTQESNKPVVSRSPSPGGRSRLDKSLLSQSFDSRIDDSR